MSGVSAQDEWISRVLGFQPPPTPSQLRAQEAKAVAPSIAYRKLLLRWRDAQAKVGTNLRSIGQALLARDDIKADPRFAEVQQAIKTLPDLVPKFGGKLEDILDDAMNAGPAVDKAKLAAEAGAAIDAYRQQLGAASQLTELEEFASSELGNGVALRKALDDELVALKQSLA